MVKTVDIRIPSSRINDEEYIQGQVFELIPFDTDQIQHIQLLKRSIDARKRKIMYNLRYDVYINEPYPKKSPYFNPANVSDQPKIGIIGSGPAGLFAALQAIEQNLCPVIFERGKNVRERRRDLAKIHKEHLVDEDSNYCFGEGGAGTYSDGKLYTRSKKRGDLKKVLEWFVHFGADPDILVDAHPHIGTNKLPKIIQSMRDCIIACGGKVHFHAKVTDLLIDEDQIKGLVVGDEKTYHFNQVILATGHSARDIFHLLHQKQLKIESKSFALGVRVEHAQSLIDQIQYHGQPSGDELPPAAYSLVTQVDGMGVYSFCMCPGGIVAPCATDQEEVVTNGWSPSKRNNPFANSGIVVQLAPEDIPGYSPNDPFSSLRFQQEVERKCWEAAGKTQAVPAQRLKDFVKGQKSTSLPSSSYQPGIVSVNLAEVLPHIISERIQKAFITFGKKMNGFMTNDAVVHAPESRTSSPIKIPRDRKTLEHVQVKGLYPCGEGAGYAGGIVSAAIDGIRCANEIKAKGSLS